MKNTRQALGALLLALLAAIFVVWCSDGSEESSSSSLAGTTWTRSYTITGTSGGTAFTGTGTYTIEFHSGGKVTCSELEYKDDGTLLYSDSNTYTYSVSGSTVTIYDNDGNVAMQLAYSSGQLVHSVYGYAFTKS